MSILANIVKNLKFEWKTVIVRVLALLMMIILESNPF